MGINTLTTQLLKWDLVDMKVSIVIDLFHLSLKYNAQSLKCPPKSYVDNGVVCLAPHGCPLVVREIVHLHRQHVNICSSQTYMYQNRRVSECHLIMSSYK